MVDKPERSLLCAELLKATMECAQHFRIFAPFSKRSPVQYVAAQRVIPFCLERTLGELGSLGCPVVAKAVQPVCEIINIPDTQAGPSKQIVQRMAWETALILFLRIAFFVGSESKLTPGQQADARLDTVMKSNDI